VRSGGNFGSREELTKNVLKLMEQPSQTKTAVAAICGVSVATIWRITQGDPDTYAKPNKPSPREGENPQGRKLNEYWKITDTSHIEVETLNADNPFACTGETYAYFMGTVRS